MKFWSNIQKATLPESSTSQFGLLRHRTPQPFINQYNVVIKLKINLVLQFFSLPPHGLQRTYWIFVLQCFQTNQIILHGGLSTFKVTLCSALDPCQLMCLALPSLPLNEQTAEVSHHVCLVWLCFVVLLVIHRCELLLLCLHHEVTARDTVVHRKIWYSILKRPFCKVLVTKVCLCLMQSGCLTGRNKRFVYLSKL